VETALFTRIVGDYLDDDEYRALQKALVANPEAGTVIRGSGGVRKIRWDAESRGKRGGVRVICFRRAQPALIWLLTIYAKNEAETISAAVLRKIKQKIEND
jgi:hypothetical protein